MGLSKRQLKKIIRETRRTLADNPYAYEGEDVGQGEIPSRDRSKLYKALSPLGFEIGAAPGTRNFEFDYLDALYASEKQLRTAGFEDPSIIIDYIKPRLEDIFRKAEGGPGGYRTEALVNAIPFSVFDAATGGRPLRSSPTRSMSSSGYDQYAMYDEEDGMQPMISDSRKLQNYTQTLSENKMKLSKSQLKRIIREEYSRLKKSGILVENAQGMPMGQYGIYSGGENPVAFHESALNPGAPVEMVSSAQEAIMALGGDKDLVFYPGSHASFEAHPEDASFVQANVQPAVDMDVVNDQYYDELMDRFMEQAYDYSAEGY